MQKLFWANCQSGFILTFNNVFLSCKLLVLGGGSGGCSIAAKFAGKLGKNQIIIVDPADRHYYQPMLTLIGGGIKQLKDSSRPMESVLPNNATWIKDTVAHIDPVKSKVITKEGDQISYDYLVVALGLELHYEKIKGLIDSLSMANSGVCSNYSPQYVERTYNTLSNFKSGNAVFTFPNTPIKCGGAPLKACFISEHYLRKHGKKASSRIYYKTALPSIFAVKHYADKLMQLCQERDIDVGLREELVEVKPDSKEAVFKNLDVPNDERTIEYSMLHVTPPMSPPEVIKCEPSLHDPMGYLKIDKGTLQHENHPNIFGIGDCTNLPTSKTAAAVAAQSGVLYDNLTNIMNNKPISSKYDGYTSCPLVTGFGSCIMAEFDYDLQPLETFPIDQSNEHLSMYIMKKDLMPQLYWHAMLRGYWRGPGLIRKILHLGMGR
ncbi:hypothetical protein AAG570_000320 [Ranatra chinensis]|uniref:Sulfide:quinone oxidoreductase, mitochondrial n=1 Tax=Ranatra chinensis TaxID=642074 RepID=A0ABD0YWP9_9HEMI